MSRTDQAIADLWEEMGKQSAGAAEIEQIQQALIERFGAPGRESPAAIARTLADNGVRLRHPEILEADARWRERESSAFCAPEELNFTAIESALAWMEKFSGRPQSGDSRAFILQLKPELELMATSRQLPLPERLLAAEVAQWLTVWLQSPQIFTDWLALRRESAEFRERFSQQEAQG